MLKLSSLSTEGLLVRVNTDFTPSNREAFKGRAQITIETGHAEMRGFPTVQELRALGHELLAAADRVEA